jgi:hypothetical protein
MNNNSFYTNGVGSGTFGTTAGQEPKHIGGLYEYFQGYNGWLTDVIFFATSLSTEDRQTLERDQGIYYGITVA